MNILLACDTHRQVASQMGIINAQCHRQQHTNVPGTVYPWRLVPTLVCFILLV